MGMLAEKQNKLDESIKYFNIGLKYVTQKSFSRNNYAILQTYVGCLRTSKKYQQFLQSYTLYKAWSDSAFNANEKKQTELKIKLRVRATSKKIKLKIKLKNLSVKFELEQERKQRNLLLIGLGVISLMFVITIKTIELNKKQIISLHKQN